MRTSLFAVAAVAGALASIAFAHAQVGHGANVYVPPAANQEPPPNPAAVVNRPVEYISDEQMDDMWERLDANGPVERHPIDDPNDQASSGGDNGLAVPHRRRMRCFTLTAFEWKLATGHDSEFGGTVCTRRH